MSVHCLYVTKYPQRELSVDENADLVWKTSPGARCQREMLYHVQGRRVALIENGHRVTGRSVELVGQWECDQHTRAIDATLKRWRDPWDRDLYHPGTWRKLSAAQRRKRALERAA